MATVRYTVIGGEVIAEKRNGVRRLYVPDPLGSTVALLDNTQAKTDTFTYWPYGEEAGRTGATPTPLRFVGTHGYYRDRLNSIYVRGGHYRPDVGRSMTGPLAGRGEYASELRPTPLPWPGFPRRWPPGVPGKYPLNYGYYCGPDQNPWYSLPPSPPGSRGPHPPKQPYDRVDTCCLYHDYVYRCHNCSWPVLTPGSPCVFADRALCSCLQRVDCMWHPAGPTRDACNAYRAGAIWLFCYFTPWLRGEIFWSPILIAEVGRARARTLGLAG